jgi:hypothetical protein
LRVSPSRPTEGRAVQNEAGGFKRRKGENGRDGEDQLID